MTTPAIIARALGGATRNGRGYLCRCPVPSHGRGKGDRNPSLSVADGADGRPLVKCFAGCAAVDVLAALRRLGILEDRPARDRAAPAPAPRLAPSDDSGDRDSGRNLNLALRLWREAVPAEATAAETYLAGRRLSLPAGAPLRYHPACPRGAGRLPAMVALMTTADGNVPVGIHRTYLRADGAGKADGEPKKAMLGRAGGAVVRLSADEDVTLGLGLSEGIETAMAALAIGWRPVWAALSAGGVRTFPVLAGIEHLTLFADADPTGREAARACASRWSAAGREATLATPRRSGDDWADIRANR